MRLLFWRKPQIHETASFVLSLLFQSGAFFKIKEAFWLTDFAERIWRFTDFPAAAKNIFSSPLYVDYPSCIYPKPKLLEHEVRHICEPRVYETICCSCFPFSARYLTESGPTVFDLEAASVETRLFLLQGVGWAPHTSWVARASRSSI